MSTDFDLQVIGTRSAGRKQGLMVKVAQGSRLVGTHTVGSLKYLRIIKTLPIAKPGNY